MSTQQMQTERQLLERAKSFDPQALEWLHERFYPFIYRYVHLRINNPQTVDDLTSEVFLRMLENLNRGRAWKTSPRAWLFGIARNVVSDHYRVQYRNKEVALNDKILLSNEQDPSEAVSKAERYFQLVQALAQLTEEQRDVIYLRFMEGLSLQESADALGKTVGAIKSLQYRAIQTMTKLMKTLLTKYPID